MRKDLRYKISDWDQASRCLSNNSRDLAIQVSTFLFDKNLEGTLIRVIHPVYGTLFAALTQARGYLISEKDELGNVIPFLSTEQILAQLEKLGFIIYYSPDVHLPGKQLSFLIDLQHLGFDKLNVVAKFEKDSKRIVKRKVISFDSTKCADLLKFGVKMTHAQFTDYLSKGYIYDISDSPANTYDFTWDWLTYVCGIPALLEANAKEGIYDLTRSANMPMPFDYTLYDEGSDNIEGII